MLALKLRTNREILTIDCSEPGIFSVHWNGISGKDVRVSIDAPLSAGISRVPHTDSIDGLSWLCQPGEMIEVEARSPGVFECQIVEMKDGQFVVKLRAPNDFLFLFEFESEVAA